MSSSSSSVPLNAVRAFWDMNPCGSQTSAVSDRRLYFAEIEASRYAHEPHIPIVARFAEYAGKDVLEVGCGLGTDGAQFASAGARYTGVDLTPAAVALATENFNLRGVTGNLRVVDATSLPFPDACFDHVYSFGVIHHAPSPELIIAEIHRVLRAGGTFCVMLYNKNSINFRVEITVVRRIARLLLVPSFAPRLIASLTGLSQQKLVEHRSILMSGKKMTKEQWLSVNTDGPECPLSRVYGNRDVRTLFRDFDNISTEVLYFDRRHWPGIARVISDRTADRMGRRWGWHRMIYGEKPAADQDLTTSGDVPATQ